MKHKHLSILMVCVLLLTFSGCGHTSAASEFPPKEKTVRMAAEALGWTLDPAGTESWGEGHVLYTLSGADRPQAAVSCALADGKRTMILICTTMNLPEEPVFAWEDWEKAVTLAETLYGGFQAGELYKSLSGVPSESDEDGGSTWEAESKAGYVRLRWSPAPGTAEHNFPESTVQDWRETVYISLYPSKGDYEKTGKGA